MSWAFPCPDLYSDLLFKVVGQGLTWWKLDEQHDTLIRAPINLLPDSDSIQQEIIGKTFIKNIIYF